MSERCIRGPPQSHPQQGAKRLQSCVALARTGAGRSHVAVRRSNATVRPPPAHAPTSAASIFVASGPTPSSRQT